MAQETNRGTPRPEYIPLCAIFAPEGLVSAEHRAAMISRVLNEFSKLPVGAQNTLRSAVNDEIIPTTGGFRKGQAGRALDRSSFLVQEPIAQAISTSDTLAGAVLQCWAESQPALREAVERHLTGRGLTTPGPNSPHKQLRGYWPMDQWQVEKDSFAQTYDDDFDQEDVALMLCYVSGNLPLAPDRAASQGGEGTLIDAMSAALSRLRELPAIAPEWERQIPDFVASVSRLMEGKAAQLRWSEEFDSIVRNVRAAYGDLLVFFEQDTQGWAAARVSAAADSTVVLKLAERLQSHLADYQPIHDRAPSFSEELERVQRRGALQPSIVSLLAEIETLMTGDNKEQKTVPSSDDVADLSAGADSPSLPAEAPVRRSSEIVGKSALPELEAEPPQPSALREAQTVIWPNRPEAQVAVADVPSVSDGEYAALKTENVGLRDAALAMRSENQGLKDEVEALKTELFGTQEREDSWRLAYRSVKEGSLEEVGVPAPLVESVQGAVEMAKSRFRQELLFAPNAESSIEDNPFTDPGRLWEALQWLATTYYPSRMGRLRVTDFDQSIKEACGWWYKSDQGETTVSRYKDSYTTRVDGRRYTLVEHIGKGTTFDARYTIRIAFDWDRDKRQVVVGYVGRHQQTDAS